MSTIQARLQDWLDWAQIEYDKGDKVKAERLLRHGMQKLCPHCAAAGQVKAEKCHAETVRLAYELKAAVRRAQALEAAAGNAAARFAS